MRFGRATSWSLSDRHHFLFIHNIMLQYIGTTLAATYRSCLYVETTVETRLLMAFQDMHFVDFGYTQLQRYYNIALTVLLAFSHTCIKSP
jgi:hypothetical protein